MLIKCHGISGLSGQVWTASWEKMPLNIHSLSEKPYSCAHPFNLIWVFTVLCMDSLDFIDIIHEIGRFLSECADMVNAQSDLFLWPGLYLILHQHSSRRKHQLQHVIPISYLCHVVRKSVVNHVPSVKTLISLHICAGIQVFMLIWAIYGVYAFSSAEKFTDCEKYRWIRVSAVSKWHMIGFHCDSHLLADQSVLLQGLKINQLS